MAGGRLGNTSANNSADGADGPEYPPSPPSPSLPLLPRVPKKEGQQVPVPEKETVATLHPNLSITECMLTRIHSVHCKVLSPELTRRSQFESQQGTKKSTVYVGL